MKNNTEGSDLLFRLVENFPNGIIVFDVQGSIVLINKVALFQFKLKGRISDYLKQPVLKVIGKNKLGEKIEINKQGGGEDFQMKSIKIGKRYFDIFGMKISEGMLLFLNDITKNVKAKNLALNNLIKGQEIERRRIAKEIHDGVGPSLSTIRLGIDTLSAGVKESGLKSKLKILSTQVAGISNDIRQISHDLMPSSLLDFGIRSALENMMSNIQSASKVSFKNFIALEDDQSFFNKSQQLNIYRIIQEAIHNGIKHGQADEFSIYLEQKSNYILLKIVDNGKSDKTNIDPGIGLLNMRSRVNSMNGILKLIDRNQNGFEVTAQIPLPN